MFTVAVEAGDDHDHGHGRGRSGCRADRPPGVYGRAALLAQLQRTAGNAAVSSLFVQRLLGDGDIVEIKKYIGEQLTQHRVPDPNEVIAQQLFNAVQRSESVAAARLSLDHLIGLQVRRLRLSGTPTAPTNPVPSVPAPTVPVPRPDLMVPTVPPPTMVPAPAPAPGVWDNDALRGYIRSQLSLTELMANRDLPEMIFNAVRAATDETADKATVGRTLSRYRAMRSVPSTSADEDSDEDTGPTDGGSRKERFRGYEKKESTGKKARYAPMARPAARGKGRNVGDLLDRARRARDDLVDSYVVSPNPPAAVVGAVDRRTGRSAAGKSGTGRGLCAEDDALAKLGCDAKDVYFTRAIRPRTGEDVPVCRKCQGYYDRNQFERGTQFG